MGLLRSCALESDPRVGLLRSCALESDPCLVLLRSCALESDPRVGLLRSCALESDPRVGLLRSCALESDPRWRTCLCSSLGRSPALADRAGARRRPVADTWFSTATPCWLGAPTAATGRPRCPRQLIKTTRIKVAPECRRATSSDLIANARLLNPPYAGTVIASRERASARPAVERERRSVGPSSSAGRRGRVLAQTRASDPDS